MIRSFLLFGVCVFMKQILFSQRSMELLKFLLSLYLKKHFSSGYESICQSNTYYTDKGGVDMFISMRS